MKTYITQFAGHITQFFGGNANPFYHGQGLKGHPGTDEVVGYGTPINAYFPMKVYKVYTPSKPSYDGTGYTQVAGIVETPLETFEMVYGHCNPSALEGQSINVGDVIGTEANHGTIYFGGDEITLAMQQAGDTRGSHRHIQKRPLRKVTTINNSKTYLSVFPGSLLFDGYYYELVDVNNGYNGCVDVQLPIFIRDLQSGILFPSKGYDVECLQRALKAEGFAPDYQPTGYFGSLTKRDVRLFQAKYGIPATGLVGPMTRAKLNELYS
jgi:hypothetical protein